METERLSDSVPEFARTKKFAAQPTLYRDASFWGLVATQFWGAFNDNVFKQLMLLLAVKGGSAGEDQQGLATSLFSLPFILFSGYAGFLSDRFSKPKIITLCKIAEIGIMALGMVAFLGYSQTGYNGLLGVLFLMGMHSAFFGPGKYGILPELFQEEDLPRANGVILMTTFLAIIFGTALAGVMGDALIGPENDAGRMWIGSVACMVIAAVGTGTSLLIRRLPPVNPQLAFHWDTLAIPRETLALLRRDLPLLTSLLVSCLFWLVSGIAMQVVNSLGLVQLGLNKAQTSYLAATIGLGIAVGAVIAGKLCAGKADVRIIHLGGWGMVGALGALSLYLPQGQHALGFWGSLPVLAILGCCAGMFAVPVQVFLQTRPPADQKGRMIATMNFANFIAIMLSGLIYAGLDRVTKLLSLPRSVMFAMIAVLLLPVLLGKLPWEYGKGKGKG